MFKRFIAVVALIAISGQASAALIINVSNVAGKTQFDLSGSDTFANYGVFNNGFWFNNLNEIGAVTGTRREGRRTLLSGTGGYDLGANDLTINSAYVNNVADHELGFLSDSGIDRTEPGMAISIFGSFVADIDYTWFVEGTYNIGALGPNVGVAAMLTDGLRLNIGTQQNAVPEPSMLGLAALALFAPTLARRTRRRMALA